MPDSNAAYNPPPGPSEPFKLNVNPESLEYIRSVLGEYGDTVQVPPEARKNASVIINHPDDIARVLVGNHQNYTKGVGFERVEMLLGKGIIVSTGDDWRRQRTMIQPGFKPARIAALMERVHQINLREHTLWLEAAERDEAFDVTTTTSEMALDIILRSIFSDDLDTIIDTHGGNPFAFLATDFTRDLSTVVRFRNLTGVITECIDGRRTDGRERDDFLASLMEARDKKTGEPMSDKELIDEVKTLIIAGHETSATTLNWAWWLIAGHPDVEERMLAEVATLPEPADLKFQDVMQLTYCKQVLMETLRLYPPVWLYTRRALGPDQLGGHDISTDMHVWICTYLLHRRPDIWPDPERFDPDRFTEEAQAERHRHAFIPFSAGSRRCIGEHFSYCEMLLHFAVMLRDFRMQKTTDTPVELDLGMNLRSRDPLLMQLSKRR